MKEKKWTYGIQSSLMFEYALLNFENVGQDYEEEKGNYTVQL